MKRHRCCVDLLENELKFNELVVSVPFLKEHEIKKEGQLIRSQSNGPTDNEEKIREFMSITGSSYDDAKKS